MNMNRVGSYLCLLLRHKPETAGLTLDEHGWANVEELLQAVAPKYPITREILEEIVRTDGKNRYSFSEDKRLIRANQGHSIPVDVELPVTAPPEFLWHGTATKYVDSIEAQGLLARTRLYVHMSPDSETALRVGKRHGSPVLYRVHAGKMAADGYLFYRSVNGVWLTKQVPRIYLERMEADDGKEQMG